MSADDGGTGAPGLVSPGHAAFAATLIAAGILGLIKGDFTAIWTGVPKAFPAREGLAYVTAVVAVGAGIGLLWARTAALASRVLLASYAIWFLLFRLPLLFRAPTSSGVWWACGETAAMVAAPWILYVRFAGDRQGGRPGFAAGDRGLRVARILYGLALIPFGIAHFTFLARTVEMVPGWLPGHLFWAYFFGWTFIAAGVAIVVGFRARLAALLSMLQMALFTLLVWVPVMTAGRPSASDRTEFLGSCALTAVAWVVVESWDRSRSRAAAGE
jgi:uncharacterized membrane protein YphA (DoxX/SURF4 family)